MAPGTVSTVLRVGALVVNVAIFLALVAPDQLKQVLAYNHPRVGYEDTFGERFVCHLN